MSFVQPIYQSTPHAFSPPAGFDRLPPVSSPVLPHISIPTPSMNYNAGYQQPPPGGFAPQQGYGQPPAGFAPQPGYGQPPQAGFAQPGYGAPQPGYGSPQPGYGAPQPGYGAPQPGYGAQPGYGPPGGGYGAPGLLYLGVPIPAPGQPLPPLQYDAKFDSERIRKATKGFGTDENTLISVMAPLDAMKMAALSRTFEQTVGKPLVRVLEKELSGW